MPEFGRWNHIRFVVCSIIVNTSHFVVRFVVIDGLSRRSVGQSAHERFEQAAEAGVDCFVAGSAVYGADDPGKAVAALREQAATARARVD